MDHNIKAQNGVFIEGQIYGLSLVDADKPKPKLSFLLRSFHAARPIMINGDLVTKYYEMTIPVNLYGRGALVLAKKFAEGDNVTVEGKLRQHESGKYKIVAVHMDHATPVMRSITPAEVIAVGEDEN